MKEMILQSKILVYAYEELNEKERELIDAAKAATQSSYAPYSKFCVGAAVRLADDTIVTGSNQENAAFPSGLCAERTALFYANASHPETAVTDIAIAAAVHGQFLSSPIPPCGACRQVILGVEERYNQPVRIMLYGTDGIYITDSIKVLLPLQFVGNTMKQ
ncbi:MAG: cytidine deaminase [Paraprevotella sp.]|nr:cytidine deaminase [Paraprevotella sp.]